MIPAAFEYFRPDSVAQAIGLLAQHGDDAKILAGGQSLIPAMRFRLAQPAVLIDIHRIKELDFVREHATHVAIGALTRETTLEEHAALVPYPLLRDAAKVVADPLVRQRATLGGNLAHADPANDHPAVMLAYGAELVAVGARGPRTIRIDDFFTGLFSNSLEPGEILTEIRLPKPPPGSGGAYVKLERKVGDYAIAGAAVQLVCSKGECKAVRIALTNVSPVPMRAIDAEAALQGSTVSDALIEQAGQLAAAACEPSSDLRGSEEYKRDVTRVVVKRAIARALARAKGEST